jgi:SAM-dependent methyltransferase
MSQPTPASHGRALSNSHDQIAQKAPSALSLEPPPHQNVLMDEVMAPEDLENFDDLDDLDASLTSAVEEHTDDLLDTLEMPVFRLPTIQEAARLDEDEDEDDPTNPVEEVESTPARPLPLSGILRRSRLVTQNTPEPEPLPEAALLPHVILRQHPALSLPWQAGLPVEVLEARARRALAEAPADALEEEPEEEPEEAPAEVEVGPPTLPPEAAQTLPPEAPPSKPTPSQGEPTQEIDLSEIQLALEESGTQPVAAPLPPPQLPNGAPPPRPPSMPRIPAVPPSRPTAPPIPSAPARRSPPLSAHPAPAPPRRPQAAPQGELSSLVQELLEEAPPGGPRPGDPTVEFAPPTRSWYEEVFNEEYFRTLPQGFHKQTRREAQFISDSLGVGPNGRILDLACGFGRHTLELAKRGYDMVGLDLSLPLLQKGLNEAQKRNLSIKFIHGDVRELNFTAVFDAAFSYHTSFGYFDDKTNFDVLCGIHRALKNGGRFLLETINRDYVIQQTPGRKWWEGADCIFLEETNFNFQTSVLHTKRSFIYDDGRPPWEQNIYIRLFSLHELKNLFQHAGLHIIEVSGDIASRNAFFGNTSRHTILLAEKRLP